jgi:hypothetical protein
MADESTHLTFAAVLDGEYRARHDGQSIVPNGATEAEALAALHRASLDEGVSALCLSGGGIRSASLSLGVLQGLARLGVLPGFDYLSTVSGGGYTGGWLSAWRARVGRSEQGAVYGMLGGTVPVDPEPAPIAQVRQLCRFLDPRLGAFSADVWTLGFTILRNLLLNWLVLLPLVAAALLVPRIYLGILSLPSQRELITMARLYRIDAALWPVGIVLLVAAMSYIALDLPSLGNRRWSQRRFIGWFLVPVCLTEVTLSVAVAWRWIIACQQHSALATALVSTAALAAPGIVGVFVGRRGWRAGTWVAALIAGFSGGFSLWFVKAHYLMAASGMAPGDPGCADALGTASDILPVYAAVDLPIALGLLVAEIVLLVGLSGRAMTDDDREWWARACAWILIVATVWLVVAGLVLAAHGIIDQAVQDLAGLSLTSGPGHALLGLSTLLTGGIASGSARTRVRRGRHTPRWVSYLFALAVPAFVGLLLLFVAGLDVNLLVRVESADLVPGEGVHPLGAGLVETLLLFTALVGIGIVAGRRVSVNLFSLHGMYRERIVRAFIGASRPAGVRRPNRFTGFDPDDDLKVAQLAALGRPLHVINCTLNLVRGSSQLSQERKGAAFTISPCHVGSRAVDVGYRPAATYAEGLSLGNAVTISGAAVSPQMGNLTTPFVTFLLTLFNARLGVWLGNPGKAGERTWYRKDPGLGPGRLLGELLGQTSVSNPYVFLSDGGHFENLGLYEMIARRCRSIVVIDAGCDPDYAFDDLGNAIRRVRIDLGIPIDFPNGLCMTPQGEARGNLHAAVGRIHYSAMEPGLPPGELLYIKTTLSGDEPIDVLNYARANPEFPHQPTSNQWFDEAQFESYRELGLHTVLAVGEGTAPGSGVAEFIERARAYVAANESRSARAAMRSPVEKPSVNRP